jgi:hypothetical protein
MNDNITEIERQFRVLRQTLFIHSYLRDNYKTKTTLLDIVIISASTIFCSATFASDQTFISLGLYPDNSKLFLKIISIIAFAASLILLIVDWKGKATLHKEAAQKFSEVLELFRSHRSVSKSWAINDFQLLSDSYWNVNRNTIHIPTKMFCKLKAKYLKQLKIGELLSENPGCPKFIINFKLTISSSLKYLKKK